MKTTSVCWPIKPERWDNLMVNTMKDKTFLHERHSRLAFFVASIEFLSSSIDKDRCFLNEGRRIYGFSMAVERKSFLLFSFLPMPLSGLFVCFQTAGGIKIIFMGLSLFISWHCVFFRPQPWGIWLWNLLENFLFWLESNLKNFHLESSRKLPEWSVCPSVCMEQCWIFLMTIELLEWILTTFNRQVSILLCKQEL